MNGASHRPYIRALAQRDTTDSGDGGSGLHVMGDVDARVHIEFVAECLRMGKGVVALLGDGEESLQSRFSKDEKKHKFATWGLRTCFVSASSRRMRSRY